MTMKITRKASQLK